MIELPQTTTHPGLKIHWIDSVKSINVTNWYGSPMGSYIPLKEFLKQLNITKEDCNAVFQEK